MDLCIFIIKNNGNLGIRELDCLRKSRQSMYTTAFTR